ncbi:MAG: hypothetical protein ACR2H4_12730 [Pyrinomonadaceae bacterium]
MSQTLERSTAAFISSLLTTVCRYTTFVSRRTRCVGEFADSRRREAARRDKRPDDSWPPVGTTCRLAWTYLTPHHDGNAPRATVDFNCFAVIESSGNFHKRFGTIEPEFGGKIRRVETIPNEDIKNFAGNPPMASATWKRSAQFVGSAIQFGGEACVAVNREARKIKLAKKVACRTDDDFAACSTHTGRAHRDPRRAALYRTNEVILVHHKSDITVELTRRP